MARATLLSMPISVGCEAAAGSRGREIHSGNIHFVWQHLVLITGVHPCFLHFNFLPACASVRPLNYLAIQNDSPPHRLITPTPALNLFISFRPGLVYSSPRNLPPCVFLVFSGVSSHPLDLSERPVHSSDHVIPFHVLIVPLHVFVTFHVFVVPFRVLSIPIHIFVIYFHVNSKILTKCLQLQFWFEKVTGIRRLDTIKSLIPK